MSAKRTFTTYMAIEPGERNTAALRKMELQAEQSLSRIQMLAQRTSQVLSASATAGAVSGTGAASIAASANAERSRASAVARSAAAQNDLLRSQIASSRQQGIAMAASRAAARTNETANQRLSQSQRRVATTANEAATGSRRLANAMQAASMAANVAQGPLGPVAGRLSAVAAGLRELGGIRFGLIGAGAAVAGYVRLASVAEDLRSKLFPLYDTQEQVNRAFSDAQQIAKNARMGLEPVIDLYSRLTLAGRDMGLSNVDISRMTELAAKTARLSGGTKISQDAGLYQFAQGIGSGTLQGDELRSIRENTIRLAKAIADGMDVPLAKLKELGAEGELTPKKIAAALLDQADIIEQEIARLPATMSMASAQMGNAFIDMMVKAENSTGAMRLFAESTMLLAENLPEVVNLLLTAGVAFAAYKASAAGAVAATSVSNWNAQRKEIAATSKATLEAAKTERRAAAERITGLRQVRASLKDNLRAEREVLSQRMDAVRKASTYINEVNSKGMATPNARGMALYNDALRQAQAASQNLTRTKTELNRVTGSLTNTTAVLTGSTSRYRQAAANAARSTSLLRSGASALIGAFNPLGIAISIATTFLIQWIFRQSEAAKMSENFANAQSRLARIIDTTTGALITQNKVLIEGERIRLEKETREAREVSRDMAQDLGRWGLGGRNRSVPGAASLMLYNSSVINDQQLFERLRTERDAAPDELTRRRLNERIIDLEKKMEADLTIERNQAGLRMLSNAGTRSDAVSFFGGTETGSAAPVVAEEDKKKKAREKTNKVTDESIKRERLLQQIQERGDKRTDLLGAYEEAPKAVVRAQRSVRELSQLVGQVMNGLAEVTENNPLGAGIYTQEMANADRDRIEEGLRRPMREAVEEARQANEMAALRLQGYSWEVDVLEEALQLHKDTGTVTSDILDDLLVQAEKEREINTLIERREALVGQVLGIVDDTKSSVEDLIVNMRKGGKDTLKEFGNNLISSTLRVTAKQFTDGLFGDAKAELERLTNGSDGVQRVQEEFARRVGDVASSTEIVVSANTSLANSTKLLTEAMAAAREQLKTDDALPGTLPGGAAERGATAEMLQAVSSVAGAGQALLTGGSSAAKPTGTNSIEAAVAGSLTSAASITGAILLAGRATTSEAANDNGQAGDSSQINVYGQRESLKEREVPTARQAYGKMFEEMGSGLDKTFKSGTFFSGIGKGVGKALAGAGEGQMASSILGMTGLKQSSTGAAIGGAIGSFIPIPGASLIGGLLGGTIGGLFSSAKRGSAIIGGSGGSLAVTGTYGNNSENKGIGTQMAGGVIGQLDQIASALGANLTAAAGSVSIGVRDGNYRVDTLGRGYTKLSNAGVYDFGEDEEAAIRFAITDLIKDGVLSGISNASLNILKAGKDLQKSIEKAAVIESIPKRLMQLQDPVRYAITELNREFSDMISYLKEGGATAQQFSDAQKLYELERAAAIEQAAKTSSDAIKQFMEAMTGGSASPFNKRTTYNNAADTLSTYRADIKAGKFVDESALLTAVQNFQDASRQLYGSSQGYFTDFDDIYALLAKARENMQSSVGSGTGGALPGSPFDGDSYVANMLGNLNSSTQQQTNILANKLDVLTETMAQAWASYNPSGTTVQTLPGFRAAA